MRTLGVALGLATIFTCLGETPARWADPAVPSIRGFHPRQTPIVEACKRIRGSVVNIHSERTATASEAMTQGTRINGMGTGVIVDSRGYIVTNHHVIEDVTTLKVRLSDGSTHSAQVLARDAETDLALLKIEANKPLPTIPLGTTRDLQVGETVVAMGNAYGYEHTVTVGVVSAMGRDVVLNRDLTYRALIQTDASINPGNSGGPLVNVLGELVGINVAIRAGAQGIGFAIPVETVIRVCADMLGQKHRGYGLGVKLREEVERPRDDGDLIRKVIVERLDPGSICAKAGLCRGDQLLYVGESGVQSMIDWEKGFIERSQGEKVNLVVKRDGKEVRLGATLGKPSVVEQVWEEMGIQAQPIGAESVAGVDARLRGGLLLRDVRPDSPAARAGWQKGDILVGLHDWEMVSINDILYAINFRQEKMVDGYRFFVVRENRVVKGQLPFQPVITTGDSSP